ncbi:hypothetical protein Rsub_07259 [Raphidocelis subcapitata]|uniref:Uncharacterized protein n=1 Tax=Raphidocelis subcapitata TaxID=307507 RepID=A0A2V0PBH0_9CHLO|nr:hypothetical protein Rsub_07259 [Raphidocelis subcapitata]|eukprot:GBF94445.1 hypothetical protein Rsub_07259 [Raphidocelis subcapitata]
MCTDCLRQGLWCFDEQQQLDKFVAGFVKKPKKRFTAPPSLLQGVQPLATAAPAAGVDGAAAGGASEQPQQQEQQQQVQEQQQQEQQQRQPQQEQPQQQQA